LLHSSWRVHDNSDNTPPLHVGQPLLYCLSFETCNYLRGERGGGRERERENGWLLLCGAQPQNFYGKKWHQNTLGMTIDVILSSNGREEMLPDPLLLMFKVTYNI
jgi:hypothetical protein